MINTITYKCSACHETFTEPYNEEIALAELRRDFPEDAKEKRENLDLICNSCYKKVKESEGVENGGDTLQ